MADGRHSVTHYETLEAHRFASLLEVHLETGRTHQIRVHMAALKHPCVGDLTYGADPTLAQRVGLRAAVAARRTPRLRAPRHRRARRVRVDLPRRPGRTPSRSSVTPTDGGADLTLRRGAAPTDDRRDRRRCYAAVAAARRARRCRRACTRRRGPGLARRRGWPVGHEVWVAERRTASCSATRCSTAVLARRPLRPRRTARARASARRCSTWSRACAPTASACGSSRRNTRARALLRAGAAWSSSSAPTGRPTRSGPRTSGWPGRARTRWRSCRGLIDEVDDQLGDLLARRVALTRAVQAHKSGTRRATPAREREIAEAMARARARAGRGAAGPDRGRRSSPRAWTRQRRGRLTRQRRWTPDCRCALPRCAVRFA